ncbi:MAG: flagellar basal body P-ring formation chaperone FlgA [bacterium]|nr:flagellar basal body P-ring formation chaperone FlgA [bacterium]
MKLLTWMSIILLLFSTGATKSADSETNDRVLALHLAQMYELNPNEFEVEVKSNRLGDVDLSETTFEFEPLTQRDPLGLFTVAVTLTGTDDKSRSGQVRFYVHQFQEVLVMTDKVQRSQEITSDKLELRRTEITNLKEQPVTDKNQLIGMRAARNLRMGAILTANGLEQTPDIESGHEISIVISDGLCRIEARGVALQNGVAGDYIKVKNRSSGKILIARVVDSRAVAIDL